MPREEELELLGRMALAIGHIEGCSEFARLIPEVRSNLVFARENPHGPADVVAVDGRITVVDGMPKAAGRAKFGASSHVARLVIELYGFDPSVRSGINFRYDPRLKKWLEDYCKSKAWLFREVDRSREPEGIKKEEGASMRWKASEIMSAGAARVPKMLCDRGDMGKEPMSVLVGGDPVEVAREVCEIARSRSEASRGLREA